MHPAISRHFDEIAAICRRYRVRRLEAFGSSARADDFDVVLSDADFLVEFVETPDLPALAQYFGFLDALQDLLGRRVDLVQGEVRNPYVRATIERDRELVFAA